MLPVDKEAEEHAKEHADEGISEVMRQRKEMREMEALLGGLGGDKSEKSGGVDECRARLHEILKLVGLEGVMIPPRRS